MAIVRRLAWIATTLAVILQLYIYTYPSLDSSQCHWAKEYRPLESQSSLVKSLLKMPYIGDLYATYFIPEVFPNNNARDIRMMAVGDPQINGNWPSTPYIKRLDHYGNDYYLRHIYQLMRGRLNPTHVSLMGDLVSSQWIGDSEFYNRTRRIIDRIYVRPRDQCSLEMDFIEKHENTNWMGFYQQFNDDLKTGVYDDPASYNYENIWNWYNNTSDEPLFLNITGNHDIGYGDATYQHMSRWRILFGKDNYWIEYDNDTDHPWRIVMLNSLSLDGPMLQPEFKEYVWKFIEILENRPYNGSTILLTHIPMNKEEGLCYDGPNVEYYTESGCHGCSPGRAGLLKSTNFISEEATQRVLNAIFKESKSGIILTGHDHYGCQNYYNFINDTWKASKEINSDKYIKEVTVRSMMGDFDGVTGIMTGIFDETGGKWDFEYSECYFAVQHIWWAAQISLFLAILFHSLNFLI